MSSLAERGIYTLLDLHQDVLWKEWTGTSGGGAKKRRRTRGYWGVPPWIKRMLPSTGPEYPWPFHDFRPWICGYFTREISSGFQRLYADEAGTAGAMAEHWKFMAGEFRDMDGVLGWVEGRGGEGGGRDGGRACSV